MSLAFHEFAGPLPIQCAQLSGICTVDGAKPLSCGAQELSFTATTPPAKKPGLVITASRPFAHKSGTAAVATLVQLASRRLLLAVPLTKSHIVLDMFGERPRY